MNRESHGEFAALIVAFVGCVALLSAANQAIAQGFKFLEVTVVDPDGKPMADVPVNISLAGTSFPMPTDEKGIVSINIPGDGSSELELAVSHGGYTSVKARWAKGNDIPDKVTIPLRKGTIIGGIVHDAAGKPVKGVKIEALATAYDSSAINSGRGELRMDIPRDLGVTDSEGRWQTNSAPSEDVAIQMLFTHPEYVSDRGFSYRGGSWEELRSLKKIVVLQKGVTVAGKVVDRDQKPIAGAQIVTGPDRYYSVTTDEKGAYRLPKPQVGRLILTVTAPGYAPDLRILSLGKGPVDADFQLEPGRTTRLRVVDQQGQPVPAVKVYADEWRGNRSLEIADVKTDEEGYWQWNDAPADEVNYGFSKEGHIGLEADLAASDEVHTLTLNPAVIVNGKVVDTETGEPIESFKYVEGVWWEPSYDGYILQSSNVETGKAGTFRFQMESACHKFCVRVEAEGYRPLVSREIMPNEGEIDIDFQLEKGSSPAGVVLTPEGQPARGASVAVGGERMPLMVNNGQAQQFSADALTTTDGEGRFELPVPDANHTIVVLHESGWAELNSPNDQAVASITLVPWSQVEGTVYEGEQPSSGETVIARVAPQEDARSTSQWYSNSTTNEAGEFLVGHLRSGPALVHKTVRYAVTDTDLWMTAYSQLKHVELVPGSITRVKIGGEGRTVEGQLTIADEDREQIDWKMGLVELIKGENAEIGEEYEAEYAAGIKEDGRFAILDVLPGSYTMKVTIYPETGASNRRWYPVATLQQSCEIVDGNGKDGVDLGGFAVNLVESEE
jgi:hypothetical protein